jgi:hypothetical protein
MPGMSISSGFCGQCGKPVLTNVKLSVFTGLFGQRAAPLRPGNFFKTTMNVRTGAHFAAGWNFGEAQHELRSALILFPTFCP